MNTFIANEDPQWIELGGGQRRKIRAYNENAMLVEVGFDTGVKAGTLLDIFTPMREDFVR